MFQVLFTIPFTADWFPPAGVPVYGFGAMLFLTFLVTAILWGPRRGVKIGLPGERVTDLAIVLFVTGLAGARLLYMIQYAEQFPGGWLARVKAFFQVWNGGIVVYGAVFGGVLGYAVFYRYVLKPLGISGWKVCDMAAPLIAVGLAIGRIGCYLNGCCWGQPVAAECQAVPLDASLGEFPLLTAHAREQVCNPAAGGDRMPQIRGLQTSTGFAIAPRPPLGQGDPRTLVVALEPGSLAAKAGLKVGDRVTGFDGKPNAVVVLLLGPAAQVEAARGRLTSPPAEFRVVKSDGPLAGDQTLIRYESLDDYRAAAPQLLALRDLGLTPIPSDDLYQTVAAEWPRGRATLSLGVTRDGVPTTLTFTPRTVSFFPTQLYETVSMLLLTALLLTYQPLRRHDGQLMVLLMLGYAAHRFLNEAIRIEPTYQLGLTLSQWISLGIFAGGLLMELYLRRTLPKLGAAVPRPAVATV